MSPHPLLVSTIPGARAIAWSGARAGAALGGFSFASSSSSSRIAPCALISRGRILRLASAGGWLFLVGRPGSVTLLDSLTGAVTNTTSGQGRQCRQNKSACQQNKCSSFHNACLIIRLLHDIQTSITRITGEKNNFQKEKSRLFSQLLRAFLPGLGQEIFQAHYSARRSAKKKL